MLRRSSRPRSWRRRLKKSGEAISPPRDGPTSRATPRGVDSAGLRGVQGPPDMLPVCRQDGCPERGDRQLVAASDGQPSQLGLWPVLSVPAQRARLWLEPQTCLPDLPGARVESSNTTAQAVGSAGTRTADRANPGEPGMVDGLHA